MAHRLEDTTPPLPPPLHVLHRGRAMVQNHRKLADTGTKAFIGLAHDPKVGHDILDPETGKPSGLKQGAFLRLTEPTVIPGDDPHYPEYVRSLREGDLWAADQATADAAGVLFEAHFAGEYPELSGQSSAPASPPQHDEEPAEEAEHDATK
jgi:hypothetical protein